MVTKRMMLGAGALALALSLSACSEDRAGGPTGVSEVPTLAVRPAPTGVAPPPGGDNIQRPPVSSMDEAVSFETGGHQYTIAVVPGGNNGITRFVQDGAILMEVDGTPATLSTATSASVTLFFEGQAIFSDVVALNGSALASIPQRFRPAPDTPAGPQLQKDLACLGELAAFGAASGYLSLELYLARMGAGSLRRLWAAAGAVAATGAALFNCLAAHW